MSTAAPSLIVLPRMPNSDTGTGQRSLLLLDAAATRGPVHVVLLDGSGQIDDLRARPGVASVKVILSTRITPKGRLARLIGPLRLIMPGLAYRPDPAFRAALRRHVSETGVDRVIFRYARLHCAAGIDDSPAIRVLVDVDDRDDQKYASRMERLFGSGAAGRRIGGWMAERLARVLRARLDTAGLVWFAAAEDVWPLSTTTGVVENVPHDAPDAPPAVLPDSRHVLFIASYAHLPNRDGALWFLKAVWPMVRARCPDAEFRIVGNGKWAEMAMSQGDNPGVRFVGRAESLDDEYISARVAVCPVREGGGSKIKVIEAASWARPVVGTSHALRGFDEALVRSMVATDDPTAMAEACIMYLQDAERARSDGLALRQEQQAHHSREAMLDRIAKDIALSHETRTAGVLL